MAASTLPWGTPVSRGLFSEAYLSSFVCTTVNWDLFSKNDLNQFRACPFIPYFSILLNKILWFTQSYAFFKSMNTPSPMSPVSIIFVISVIKSKRAVSTDLFFINPCCDLVNN